ncbi:MAG TPA: hypothetical protein VHY91_14245 [Pirellulales bacterium]|jgi:hypothetical protein|nr:hypothetical protein [Pirellulales bacterium]
MRVYAVDHPELLPLEMPPRFKHDIAYFMTPAGEHGAPARLAPREYWIDPADARRWLDEGVLTVISPLDSLRRAELEITEQQEAWLEWLLAHDIRHVRVED